MSTIRLTVQVAALAMAASTLWVGGADASLVWDGDASRGIGVFGNLNCASPGSVTAVDDATHGRVWRYYKPGSSNRCENHGISVNESRYVFREDQTYHLGWWSRLSSTVNNNANFQWKSYGNHIQNYPVLLKMISNRITLQYRAPGESCCRTLWSAPISANTWHHYALGLHLSSSAGSGWIELWFDGTQQLLANGSTRYPGRTLDDINEPKWGVYGASDTTVTNYVDGLKVGTTHADVADGGGGTMGIGRTEAENMTKTNYETNSFEGVTCARATSTTLGNVRGTFGGSSATYSITVRYHDENDGQATLRVRVAGTEVGSRTLNVDDHTWKSWTISNVAIDNGDEIRIEGAREEGEHARVDYIVIE